MLKNEKESIIMRAKIKNGAYYYDNLTQVATETHNGNVYQKYIYHDMSICKSKEARKSIITNCLQNG